MKIINKLLRVTPEDVEAVRKIYNKSEDDIKQDLEILKEWLAKQQHLPKNYDENRLERILLRNKFRIEETKNKIDSYFTLRGMYPDFFQNTESSLGFETLRKSVVYVPLPQLTDKKERIVFLKYNIVDIKYFNIKSQFEYILSLVDLEFTHDYAASTRFIVDFENYTMAHFKAFELNAVIKGMSLYQTAYSERISAIDYLNMPKFFDLVLGLFKLAMKPKMYNRIKVHKNLDSLYECVRKEYLPSDYGGGQRSTTEIHEEMGEMWKQEQGFLAENAKLVSNEKLRVGKPYSNELFGTDGTFKKINLDYSEVRKLYNKSEDDVEQDLKILKEWLAKQPHLPQNYDIGRLERMLMRNKFRMEETKNKIDSYFTLRGLYPDFFQNTAPSLGFESIRKAMVYVPLPKLTENKERIVILKFTDADIKYFDVKTHFEYILSMVDLEFTHDYAAHTRFIVDFEHFTMAHFKAFELNVVLKGMSLYQTAYSERIRCLDYLNMPKFIDLLLGLFKLAMKPKMFNKIKIHKNLDSLHQHVRKEYLPSDYGGAQRSTTEIHDEMGEMWKEEMEFLAENAKLVSNEKLRVGKPYSNDLFGTDGTFKKINLD